MASIPRDNYVWGNLNDEVYRVNLHTEGELKKNIQRRILEVPEEELLRVNSDLFKRHTECIRVKGLRLQLLL
jgi:hypothetical protein